MNPSMIGVLFRHELRMILRDKRSILVSFVLPLILMPIMLFSSTWMQQKRQQKLEATVYEYALVGPESDFIRGLMDATRERFAAEQKTNSTREFSFKEVQVEDPLKALTNREIHLVLESRSPGETTPAGAGREGDASNLPRITIAFRADRDDASMAAHRLESALHQTRSQQREELLIASGFPVPIKEVATISTHNVASEGHVAGLSLGRLLTLLLMFFMMMAGAMVASDLIAGEKERGTLETLLTSGANRVEIVTAKHLVIAAVAAIITLIQVANLLVYVGFEVIPMPAHFAAAVPPHVALLLLALFLPVTGVIASVLLLTSGYAKTYKEAQMYFTPVFLLGLLPALTPMLPGLSLRSAIVVVPVANIALAAKEVLVGVFDWPMLFLAWIVTAGTAVWTMRLSVRLLSAERLVTAAEIDRAQFSGGPELFSRRVLLWFGLLWAVLLISGNYTAEGDLRFQVFFNVVVLFFGASLVMIRRYKLHYREVFALRAPRPAAWLAVLAAAPCGILAGTGLFRLANLVFPVPPELLESFTQAVIPPEIPLWQLLFFLALLPAVFEELTFRGVLLHGLHKRLRPVPLALVVGLVFGIFHAALFRLAPTAFLGVLLAAVTLLTGSIFPAMLWHALNNALGLLAGLYELPIADLGPEWYALGFGGLAISFWILWRHRTPYPGLKP